MSFPIPATPKTRAAPPMTTVQLPAQPTQPALSLPTLTATQTLEASTTPVQPAAPLPTEQSTTQPAPPAPLLPATKNCCEKKMESQQIISHSTRNQNFERLSSKILDEGFCLNNEHIEHGQWLLSQQCPEGKGLHSFLTFEGKNRKVNKGLKDFVQIFNVSGNR